MTEREMVLIGTAPGSAGRSLGSSAVGHGVAQVGDALDAHSECESLISLRIYAAVLEHDRWTMPAPRIVIQPDFEQAGQPTPPQTTHSTSKPPKVR